MPIIFLIFCGFCSIGCSSVEIDNIDTYPQYEVQEVLSGDTIRFSNGDVVQYFGIEAPKPEELFYQESKARNKALVEGKLLAIYKSPYAQKEANFQRVYAYLPTPVEEIPIEDRAYIRDKKNLYYEIAATLLSEGLAKVSNENDPKYEKRYKAFERQASEERRGLWAVNSSLRKDSNSSR